MTKREAVRLFGSAYRLSQVLGISRQAVSQWPDDVPTLRVYQIKVIMAARKGEEK